MKDICKGYGLWSKKDLGFDAVSASFKLYDYKYLVL